MQGGLSQGEAQGGTLMTIYGLVYKEAYIEAMRNAVEVSLVGVVIAIILVLFMRGKKKNKSDNDRSDSINTKKIMTSH
ncbi:MAG: hypothetical protein PWQ70_2455 [Clostridiales bacterium]|jgi:hypothetical protein|nr:hypothetical protein [Clostridiales bacterium]